MVTDFSPALGLYIHIPWCVKKCPYCDFNSHAADGDIQEMLYVDALLNDLQQDLNQFFSAVNKSKIDSIFIGGGTPSLLSPEAYRRLFEGLRDHLLLADGLEITLEANPGTFESAKFAEFNALGINRLSIGVQSFNDDHLQQLGRIHNAEEAERAVEIAFQAGFSNINVDLMFGLPEQSVSDALMDIERAVALKPGHISFYQLTMEPNTWFYKFPPSLPEDDEIFNMQAVCQEKLAEQGYLQYEISAYAQNQQYCRHNLNYWQFGDYLGIGAGAHGKLSLPDGEGIIRTLKHKNPLQYQQDQATKVNHIEDRQLPLEFLMNQLRLKKGFHLNHFCLMTGLKKSRLEPALTDCIEEGLLVKNNERIVCSERGWYFLDEILQRFLV